MRRVERLHAQPVGHECGARHVGLGVGHGGGLGLWLGLGSGFRVGVGVGVGAGVGVRVRVRSGLDDVDLGSDIVVQVESALVSSE